MSRLVSLALARPRRVLAAWLAVVGVLGLLGLSVESKLHRSDLAISGTETQKMLASLEPRFGESFDSIVLLEGRPREIDRQGRRLARALDRIPGASVLAPWMDGSSDSLRPRRGAALLVVRAHGSFEHVSERVVPQIRSRSQRLVRPPLRWHVSGYPDIAAGIHGGTVEAIEKAEIVAVPLLLVILLLVFRSPIAAALPLLIGMTAIGGVRGVLVLVNGFYPLDALALNVASMMGLALGVDYGLLMVSRFREQLAVGDPPHEAVRNAARAAGHTVVSAGLALVVAMVATVLVVPGGLLAGVGIGLIAAVVLCVAAALTALPAVLVLLGVGIDRWTFGDVRRRSRLGGLATRALRRPALALALVLGLVAVPATLALAFETGPPDPRALAPGSVERDDYVAVRSALGAGWIAPYEIAIASERGPLTERARLAAIDRFQRRLLARRDVAAVLGPGEIARRARPLERLPRQLTRASAALRDGRRDQARLVDGLARARNGVDQAGDGLADAAVGADRLRDGGAAAGRGAADLTAGVDAAHVGAGALQEGLVALTGGQGRSPNGARRIVGGVRGARVGFERGVRRISSLRERLVEEARGIGRLRAPARLTADELERGLSALDRMPQSAKLHPSFGQARDAILGALGAVSGRDPATGEQDDLTYSGLDAGLGDSEEAVGLAASSASSLLARSRRLARGLARLQAGVERLARGSRKLLDGAARLDGGLGGLESGSSRIGAGVARLTAGADELSDGLGGGAARIGVLRRGVERMRRDVAAFRRESEDLSGQAGRIRRVRPAFESGYFTLAALDRARPPLRRTTSFALNVGRGGTGARIAVVGYGNAQKDGHPLRAVLERELAPLSRATGATARLGGTATGLQDFDRATADRLPLLALVLTLATFVVLVGVLRSLLLPLLAVVFNLLTVAAAFGVMVFCFQGADPLLGGPGFIDAITAFGVFSIMFGLSIDYEVFLLARVREGYSLTGSTEGAIAYGVERTAGVITGAALIMTAVFAAFATTGLTAARQLGLALTVAVLLDATLIRLVLLPAAMRLCGRANWWLPRPLRRVLGDPRPKGPGVDAQTVSSGA